MSNKRIVIFDQQESSTPSGQFDLTYEYVEAKYLSSFEESMKSFEKLGIVD